MADKDAFKKKMTQAKEDVVEFESEMPEKAKGALGKAKGALRELKEKAKEAFQDIKHHKP